MVFGFAYFVNWQLRYQSVLKNTTAIHSLPATRAHQSGSGDLSTLRCGSPIWQVLPTQLEADRWGFVQLTSPEKKGIAANVDTIAKGKWPPIDPQVSGTKIWPCMGAWMCTVACWSHMMSRCPMSPNKFNLESCSSALLHKWCHQNKSPRHKTLFYDSKGVRGYFWHLVDGPVPDRIRATKCAYISSIW